MFYRLIFYFGFGESISKCDFILSTNLPNLLKASILIMNIGQKICNNYYKHKNLKVYN